MARNILLLAHVDESGNTLPKAAYECLGATLELAECVSGTLTVGVIGEDIQNAANTIASAGVSIFGVAGTEFAHPRYATDAAALEAICREAIPDIVIAPATSRFLRVMAGVAQRLNGQIDTHITAIEVIDGQISAKRWFYRQRLEAVIQRHASPWFLLVDAGCHEALDRSIGRSRHKEDRSLNSPQRPTDRLRWYPRTQERRANYST